MSAPITTRLIPTPLSGSETLSRLDTSHQVTLTPVQLSMFDPAILPDTRNVISSPGLADGQRPSGLPGGLTISPSGLEAAHASRSPLPASAGALKTSGTFGQHGSVSSARLALELSLENRLRERLTGSHLYEVIWRPWVTCSGHVLSRPRARALVTSGIASGLLPTPSGTSNHGKNHVAGRLDEWGGSTNPFRGTPIGNVHCPAFELWVMGYPDQWGQLMPRGTPSFRKSRRNSSSHLSKPSMKSMLE